MTTNPRIAFFDGIADKWDGWEDLDALAGKLDAGLEELGLGPDETVLDVGCGTGNLTRALLARLSEKGRVVAVDISPRMIQVARRKITDERVVWRMVDGECLPLMDDFCDRVVCYSVWPHFEDPTKISNELLRVLRPGGLFHIWHLISRERINEIHASAGEAIRGDVLPPAEETAALLARAGFEISTGIEDGERYLVTARKVAR